MNQNKTAMRIFKILLIPACLLAVMTFSNCTIELDCGSLSKNNPAFSISMFRKPVETMTFVNGTRTLVLRKTEYTFSEPYSYTCESAGLMATFPSSCDCIEKFYALYYLNDTIPFSMEINVHKPNNESANSTMYFTLAVAGSHVREDINPDPAAVLQFVDEKIVAAKIIEGENFRNIWDIPIMNDLHISRVIVEEDKGLVAIVYEGELFTLSKGAAN